MSALFVIIPPEDVTDQRPYNRNVHKENRHESCELQIR